MTASSAYNNNNDDNNNNNIIIIIIIIVIAEVGLRYTVWVSIQLLALSRSNFGAHTGAVSKP